MNLLGRLLRWLEWPINVLLWGALAAGTLMMLHVSVDVAGRTLFNSPLPGTTEVVSAYYMVLVAYLPWAWVARRDNHLSADIFTRNLSPRRAEWLNLGINLFVLLYVSVFTWQTWLRALQQTRLGEVWQAGSGFILVWPSRFVLPLAGGLMALYLLLRIVQDVLPLARREERAAR